MSNTVFVINKKTGRIGKFPRHLLEAEGNLELYVERVEVIKDSVEVLSEPEVSLKPLSYKEMKDRAKELGHDTKGNIKKQDLKTLLGM